MVTRSLEVMVLLKLQGMVVSLATDKGVWDAVKATSKIQELRECFNGFEGKSFLSSLCR